MTETPKYAVVKKEKEIEIRQYSGYIQAEVTVDGQDYQSAIQNGFRILAGYNPPWVPGFLARNEVIDQD